MACSDKDKVLSYVLNELHGAEHKRFCDHVETCAECGELLRDLEETGKLLHKRSLQKIPAGLVDRCLRRIRIENRPQRISSGFTSLLDRFILWHRPVWGWAVIVVVFLGGLGLGKLLFKPPTWLERYGRLAQSQSIIDSSNENRSLRNYFISVEALFLDLTNMDDSSLLDDDEWDMEMDITQEVLRMTRQIKNEVKDRDQELRHLVTEIELVLEDVLGTAEINLAELSKDVRQTIDERKLLTKIHGFIS